VVCLGAPSLQRNSDSNLKFSAASCRRRGPTAVTATGSASTPNWHWHHDDPASAESDSRCGPATCPASAPAGQHRDFNFKLGVVAVASGLHETRAEPGSRCCGYSKVLKFRGLLILPTGKLTLVSDEGASSYLIQCWHPSQAVPKFRTLDE
jgi:hypothetical protein